MILSGDFCTLQTIEQGDGMIKAGVRWNAEHPIFNGHFPGEPVVPGVCMIQLIQETMEAALERPVHLVSSSQVKFLHVIDPSLHPTTDLLIQYSVNGSGTYQTNSSILHGATTFLKMNAVFSTP